MQTETKADVLIRTREEFMAEGERLLDLGVISVRDLHTLESQRNLKLVKLKEEQKRMWREKAKKMQEMEAKKPKAVSIRPIKPVESKPETGARSQVQSAKTPAIIPSKVDTKCATKASTYSKAVSKPAKKIRPSKVQEFQPGAAMYPQPMVYTPPQLANRFPISPLQPNIHTNAAQVQNRFPVPAKPVKTASVPKPNFNKRYVGTVTRLQGNVYCQGLYGEVILDGKAIFDHCIKEGDGIEFKVIKSRYGSYKAEDIELL